jgi:hypothetical protein
MSLRIPPNPEYWNNGVVECWNHSGCLVVCTIFSVFRLVIWEASKGAARIGSKVSAAGSVYLRSLKSEFVLCFGRSLRLRVSNGGQEIRVSDLHRSCGVSVVNRSDENYPKSV